MNKSKAAIIVSRIIAIVQICLGAFVTILFGIPAVVSMFDSVENGLGAIVVMWILTLIGIVLVIVGMKRKKSITVFKQYVSYLSGDPSGSVAGLAAAAGASQDEVRRNLKDMIDKKYFVNAHIDEDTNCIIIKAVKSSQEISEDQHEAADDQQMQYTSVTCKSCGGMNKILKGMVSECEYCGSPIKQ